MSLRLWRLWEFETKSLSPRARARRWGAEAIANGYRHIGRCLLGNVASVRHPVSFSRVFRVLCCHFRSSRVCFSRYSDRAFAVTHKFVLLYTMTFDSLETESYFL